MQWPCGRAPSFKGPRVTLAHVAVLNLPYRVINLSNMGNLIWTVLSLNIRALYSIDNLPMFIAIFRQVKFPHRFRIEFQSSAFQRQ